MTVITTKRLTLRDPHWIHIKSTVKWLNDPDVVMYSEQRHCTHTDETQIQYLKDFLDERGQIRAIFSGGDLPIGNITAHVDENNSVANVGILIGEKKEWGKGYGTEAWQAFCDYLLANGIRKIEAGAMACNYGMIRIFLKTGMHPEGRRSGHFLLSGPDTEVDLVQWARFL